MVSSENLVAVVRKVFGDVEVVTVGPWPNPHDRSRWTDISQVTCRVCRHWKMWTARDDLDPVCSLCQQKETRPMR